MFEKGKSGNKGGRPKGATTVPYELKTNRKHEVAFAIDRQMMANAEEFREIAGNPKASMLEMCIAKTIQEFIKSPVKASKPMEVLLSHWIGKPKESVDLSSSDGTAVPTVIKIVSKDD